MNVYSFKDTSGVFSHPSIPGGSFSFFGQIGIGKFTVSMVTDRSVQSTAADGNVMVSAIAGDAGECTIETQQTSILHQVLLAWFNFCIAAQKNGDVSSWLGASLSIRNITTTTGHVLIGISPGKMPDMPYEAQGQNVTWRLVAADVHNF